MDHQHSHASSFQWISFAYQGLTEIPYETILAQQDTLEVLDLSYNMLDDPYWNPALLGHLEKLSTLVLDCNNYTSHVKFPYMSSVTTLCINKNKINNLPVFVEEVKRKFPSIKILSMMNNEAAPSYFNGGSLTQYTDYRLYVISQIPGLEILDDTEVLEKERTQARKTYRLQQSGHSSRTSKEHSSLKHFHILKKSLNEHQVHVRWVLQRLLENKLFVKAEKCEFHTPFTTFLGLVISHNEIIMALDKVDLALRLVEVDASDSGVGTVLS
ncbi:leucine-rich melanocyte differentiation-associated protein [Pholidichthys leucotaenia]